MLVFVRRSTKFQRIPLGNTRCFPFVQKLRVILNRLLNLTNDVVPTAALGEEGHGFLIPYKNGETGIPVTESNQALRFYNVRAF